MNRDQIKSEARSLCKKYFSTIDTSALRLSDMFRVGCEFRQRASEETKSDIVSEVVYLITAHVVGKYGIENNKR